MYRPVEIIVIMNVRPMSCSGVNFFAISLFDLYFERDMM